MKLLKNGLYVLGICLLAITTSCENDDDISSIIGGLDFVVATLNADGTEVGVVASTVPGDNRILYTVEFGDPNGIDIEDGNGNSSDVIQTTSGPMVKYKYPEETATYTITVTASLPGRDDVSITKDHTVIFAVEPPPGGDDPLVGSWRLAPEAGAFGVGPGLNDVSWFSSSSDDVTTRACLFDDEYVFNADGTFQNVLGSETWLETWQGVATEACGTPVFPHDGSASATYDYDATAGTITINGTGAFLGLAKVFNLGELTNPADAPSSITYLADLSADGNTLDLDIEIAGGGYWSFKLVKDVVPTGIQGTWRMAPESGAFGVGPAMGDVSWFSSTADDVTTRDCFFDDEYVFNADGSFQNVLGSETWLEGWQGVATEGCGAPVFPHDGTASATYDYDEGAGTITIDGAGAFLGLAKVFNLGELTNPADAPSSITYIAELSADGNTLDLDIEIAGGGYWSFKLARQ